ncbi:hypothetical protein RJ640_016220 [Escallonia rubra]|uniref:Uncharacterized protein n=1 Tax=Escallonia rubra TaxID=112253 RepID=A0AA88QKH5_9ASTE|nr:hypothetical protein RJ640_016220 [Escallonia rubra]
MAARGGACGLFFGRLQNDLIGQYDELPTCKTLRDQLKFTFGRTSTTRLRSLVIKFEEYTKDPKHTMSEHLRVMSNMIGKLRDVGYALIDEQQVRDVIRSLSVSWANMKQLSTSSENIKNFSDVSEHVILEAETRDAEKTFTYVAQEGPRNANDKRERQSKKGKRGEANTSAPKGGRMTKSKRGKRGGKKVLSKVYGFNWQQKGHFARDSAEPKRRRLNPHLPSPSEGGELVPRPVVAEDSVSDLQPSGSIPDSGSTPQGPLGQQDSQLRRGAQYPSHLRLCHEEDTQCRYFSMYPWIMDDAVSRGMSRKAVGSNWNDMRALGRKFNITPCCVIHSPGDFVDFHFDMSHEYITYERFNTAHYEGFESV